MPDHLKTAEVLTVTNNKQLISPALIEGLKNIMAAKILTIWCVSPLIEYLQSIAAINQPELVGLLTRMKQLKVSAQTRHAENVRVAVGMAIVPLSLDTTFPTEVRPNEGQDQPTAPQYQARGRRLSRIVLPHQLSNQSVVRI